ncbi:hypothetical protein LOAG_01796 [Loa loa]|uniref:Uncharacterized protein n=1 Tax=Loa loa TaxID=7209 RepID=A0A1S0U844_LOALO|nr:hypothetical protein LOAG_01796 [Loa loa]EFO26690.1 hypothetical protein LOAG_01796 [Loa loa]
MSNQNYNQTTKLLFVLQNDSSQRKSETDTGESLLNISAKIRPRPSDFGKRKGDASDIWERRIALTLSYSKVTSTTNGDLSVAVSRLKLLLFMSEIHHVMEEMLGNE